MNNSFVGAFAAECTAFRMLAAFVLRPGEADDAEAS